LSLTPKANCDTYPNNEDRIDKLFRDKFKELCSKEYGELVIKKHNNSFMFELTDKVKITA